jgi:hypothetical protein
MNADSQNLFRRARAESQAKRAASRWRAPARREAAPPALDLH